MRENIISRLKSNPNNWIYSLIIITLIAIIIRSIPAFFNPAWGADFGIYYGLTNYFIESKELFNSYNGWGDSYQYFPVLYAISGISHWITGIGLIDIMPKIAPIFGGLTIPIFYFIVYELMKNRKLAIISAALLSVATFHVYQTSHAAPLTIGHFFMMLSIYFFIKFITNKKYIIPLLFSTILLILSHHFTTYFYLISITFILFSILSENFRNKNDFYLLMYVFIASLATFSYWALIAQPVFNNFMQSKMFFSPYFIISLFYILLFFGYFLIKKIKSWNINLPSISYLKRFSDIRKFLIFFLSLFLISIFATTVFIPGVYVKLTSLAIIYSIPMIFLVSLSFTGFSDLKKSQGGIIFRGWIIAISLSFIYSLTSSNFFPDRHLEYIIIPLCVPAAIVLKNIISLNKKPFVIKPHLSPIINSFLKNKHIKTGFVAFVSFMCVSNLIAAYPTIDALNHIDERVTSPCIDVINWMDGNITNNSIIVSDHRLEMLLWAEGFNISYGTTNITWISNNISNCISEFNKLNIEYIFIDDIMRNGVVNVNVGNYYYMSNESYDKFNLKPFDLVYRNVTYDINGVELHWAELYKINYSYVDI